MKKLLYAIPTVVLVTFTTTPLFAQTQSTISDLSVEPVAAATARTVVAPLAIPSQTHCQNCYGNCPEGQCGCSTGCVDGSCNTATGVAAVGVASGCGNPGCTTCGVHGCATSFPRPIRNWWYRDVDYFQSTQRPPCPGYSVNYYVEAQKAAGRVAQMVYHGFHFQKQSDGTLGLSQSGRNKTFDIARFWNQTPGSLLLQPSGSLELDQQRRDAILLAFAEYGIELAAEQVVFARPIEPGMTGDMAVQVYTQRLQGSPLNPVMGSNQNSSGSQAGLVLPSGR